MKISLVMPRLEDNPYGKFNVMPLGLVILATKLKQEGYAVKIYDELRGDIFDARTGEIMPEILYSDVVGISIISPAATRAYDFLRVLKKKNPETRTLAGGSHVLDYDEAEKLVKEFGVNVVIRKEAENVIVPAVRGELEGIIEGIPVEDLDEVPIPDFSLVHNYDKKNIYERIWGGVVPMFTARGCPRGCFFCSVGEKDGKKVRVMSVGRIEEIVRYLYGKGYRTHFDVSDNWSLANRENELEMRAKLQEEGMKVSTTIQDEVKTLNKKGAEYVNMMKKAGISRVMLGVENLDSEVLRKLGKPHREGEAEDCIRMLRKYGIKVHSFGMVDPEHDTKRSVCGMAKKLRKLGVDTAQFTLSTPFPGTPFYKKVKDKLLTRDWSLYDGLHQVFNYIEEGKGNVGRRVRYAEKLLKEAWLQFNSHCQAMKQVLKLDIIGALITEYCHRTAKKMKTSNVKS